MAASNRGTFLRGSGAAAAFAALPNRAGAQTSAAPVTLKLGATPSDDMTPIVYAQKSGIFQKYGLEVEVTRMPNGPAVAAGVLSGAFDFGKSSVTSIFSAHEKGLPFTIVAVAIVYESKAPYGAFVVARDSPIQTGKDFNNQLVALGALGGIGWMALLAWVDQHGGDSKTIRFVEIPFTASVSAVESGRVAAAESSYPAIAVALERGLRVIPAYDGLGPQYVLTAWVTTKEFSTKHPQLVRTFHRAYVESATYTNAHHAETAPMMAEFTGIGLGTIQHMVRGTAGTTIAPALLQTVIDASVKYGAIKQSFPAQEIIDANVR
jgi:NitT/TauT family transport system substrate-binding protein